MEILNMKDAIAKIAELQKDDYEPELGVYMMTEVLDSDAVRAIADTCDITIMSIAQGELHSYLVIEIMATEAISDRSRAIQETAEYVITKTDAECRTQLDKELS